MLNKICSEKHTKIKNIFVIRFDNFRKLYYYKEVMKNITEYCKCYVQIIIQNSVNVNSEIENGDILWTLI